MPPSNYPPGVTGNEPQITGEPEDYDFEDVPEEKLYLVHTNCGEAFDQMDIAFQHAHSGDCLNHEGRDLDSWSLVPESEAL